MHPEYIKAIAGPIMCGATPEDSTLDNQGVIDAYYRVQLTPEIQVGPVIEVIFDPVRHPDEDTVYVWGFRSRIAL